jgi:glutathione S-transferase
VRDLSATMAKNGENLQSAHWPILYSFRRCPYAMRARLALYLSGINVQLREVALRNKPAALLLASPKGTVPVLILASGQVIEQSLDIMRWALAQQLASPICCDAEQIALIGQHDADFKPLLDRYKYPERYPEASAAEHQYNAMYWLKTKLEYRLESNTHLFGSQLGIADLGIMPFVRQCAGVDAEAFRQQASPQLQAWLAQLIAQPAFVACMEKYPDWHAGDAVVRFGPEPN